MRNKVVLACLALLVMASHTPLVRATQVEYVSPRQMGEESAVVVRGTVASVRSFWNEARTKVLTETVIQVDETYKGEAAGAVSVLQLGGVVGHMRVHVHGALTWRRGEEVLLFLDRMEGTSYRVAGFSQGKFLVERDPATGEAYVNRPALEGVEVFGAPPDDGRMVGRSPVLVPLDKFVNQALGQK